MNRMVALVVCLQLVSTAAAAVFPSPTGNKSNGQKNGLYMVVYDDTNASFSGGIPANYAAGISDGERVMREFYAENSGGKYDLTFDDIVPVPLTLVDGHRPNGWRTTVQNYVQSTYGLNAGSYHLNVFDVSFTPSDEMQGWSGVYWGNTNDIAIQAKITSDWGKTALDHELGHRVGLGHAHAFRAVDNDDFTPYVYDREIGEYVFYNAGTHGAEPAPFGVREDAYGNPFSAMGNIANQHFTARDKHESLGWLTDTQRPWVNSLDLDSGPIKLYAHNELSFTTQSGTGVYGVEETYDPNAMYGLKFQRNAEQFNKNTGLFTEYTQQLSLEYRVNEDGNGRDGVQFHLFDTILDLDTEGGLTEVIGSANSRSANRSATSTSPCRFGTQATRAMATF